jgi:hypothetical protein
MSSRYIPSPQEMIYIIKYAGADKTGEIRAVRLNTAMVSKRIGVELLHFFTINVVVFSLIFLDAMLVCHG